MELRTNIRGTTCTINTWSDEARTAAVAARKAHGGLAESASDYKSHMAAGQYHHQQAQSYEKAGRSTIAAEHMKASRSHEKAAWGDAAASKRARNQSSKAHQFTDAKEAEIAKFEKKG